MVHVVRDVEKPHSVHVEGAPRLDLAVRLGYVGAGRMDLKLRQIRLCSCPGSVK